MHISGVELVGKLADDVSKSLELKSNGHDGVSRVKVSPVPTRRANTCITA